MFHEVLALGWVGEAGFVLGQFLLVLGGLLGDQFGSLCLGNVQQVDLVQRYLM